jgi:hypothetical protein
MKINIEEIKGVKLAVIESDKIELWDVQSAVDILGNCNYQGASKIIMNKENITPDFFELKTRIAGEILQKFSNYRMQLAIVGDFTEYKSKSLHDFIYESNKVGRILFVDSLSLAKERLNKN